MKNSIVLINLFVQYVLCRDFYLGMFKRDDYLVAQDNLYKERRPYSYVQAQYGRLFKCPITYFRVVDRLGVGSGPTVKIVRGGLQKKYIAVRIKSRFNYPISVNIYVGCENKQPRLRPIRVTPATTESTTTTASTTPSTKGSTNATTSIAGTTGELTSSALEEEATAVLPEVREEEREETVSETEEEESENLPENPEIEEEQNEEPAE